MTDVTSALVIWYSQTGNTRRCGRLIAKTLEKEGLSVHASDYRNIDPKDLENYDMIVAGTPVYYYEVPVNFRRWLEKVPRLDGKPVAAYVTFGGEGGNQFNTAVGLIELLADKGGIPLALDMYSHMSSFAITWSTVSTDRVLAYSHLPDEATYDHVREFAKGLIGKSRTKEKTAFHKRTDFREWIKGGLSIWGTKLLINRHTVDTDRCIQCGTCTRLCPVSAIDPENGSVDTGACIACLGCVNNCPEAAVDMEYMFRKVYGYKDFVRQNTITIHEPVEFGIKE